MLCVCRLDEKSIIYGRTGLPSGSQQHQHQQKSDNLHQLNPKSAEFRDSRPSSQEGSSGLEPNKGPTFSLLQGEALRCLSPAEEV